MKNKVITGFGRSGTMFLSSIIEECTDLNSFHEKTIKKLVNPYPVREQLNFIECNSYYRYCICDNRAEYFVVLRKPSEICFSISKRYYDISKTKLAFEDLYRWYNFLEKERNNFQKIYFFEYYTTQEEYLYNFFVDLGAKNIDKNKLTAQIGNKINKSVTKAKTLKEVFSKEEIKKIMELDLKYEKYKNFYSR